MAPRPAGILARMGSQVPRGEEAAGGTWMGLAVLFVALVLRLQGITFGLDPQELDRAIFNNNLDERGMVDAVQKNLLHGNLDPGSFVFRGPAGFLVFGAVDAALVAALGLGREGGFAAARAALEANPSRVFLAHRCVNALAGAMTALLVFLIARREWGARAGLAAGLFLAAAYAHARDSHYGTVDVLWSLVGLWTLDRMWALWRAPEARGRAWRIGAGLGLSIGIKYHAVVLGLPLALLLLLRARREGVRGPMGVLARVGLGACATFLLLYPGLFVAPDTFRSIFGFQLATNTSLARGADLFRSIAFHLRHSLFTGLGEPVFALALLGLPSAWRHGGAARASALAAGLLSPLLFATAAFPVRYAMGLFPLLALLAGFAFVRLTQRLRPMRAGVLLVVALAPSLVRTVSLNRLLPRTDTRVEMLATLRARGLPASEVLAVGTHHGIPSPQRRAERLFTSYVAVLLGTGLERGELQVAPDFEEKLARLLAEPPRLILWDLSREDLVLPGKERVAELVRARYREVLRLDGRKADVPMHELREEGGGHMVPYGKPWTMSRPGPPLVLYERVD